MEALLSEDDTVRGIRIKSARELCYSLTRTLLIFGFPICVAASFWFYTVDPDSKFHYIAALLVIPFFLLIFAVFPYLSSRVQNRWLIGDGTLRVKGYRIGKVLMSRLSEWSIKPFLELEGYYILSVNSKTNLNGVSIYLSELDHPIESIYAMFPSKKVIEQVAASDR